MVDDARPMDGQEARCPECGETTIQIPCYECHFGTCQACGYPCACPDVEEAYSIAKAANDQAGRGSHDV